MVLFFLRIIIYFLNLNLNWGQELFRVEIFTSNFFLNTHNIFFLELTTEKKKRNEDAPDANLERKLYDYEERYKVSNSAYVENYVMV